MSDELHSMLAEAGFYAPGSYHDGGQDYTCPIADCCGATLSELIGACGNSFYSLTRGGKGKYSWHADELESEAVQRIGYGHTAEEAVASLWLELRK